MSGYNIDLPARRAAWLVDYAYQVRLTEQARTLVAAAADLRSTQLRLDAASMPETRENAHLAEFDEGYVHFTFRALEISPDEDRIISGGAQYRS